MPSANLLLYFQVSFRLLGSSLVLCFFPFFIFSFFCHSCFLMIYLVFWCLGSRMMFQLLIIGSSMEIIMPKPGANWLPFYLLLFFLLLPFWYFTITTSQTVLKQCTFDGNSFVCSHTQTIFWAQEPVPWYSVSWGWGVGSTHEIQDALTLYICTVAAAVKSG